MVDGFAPTITGCGYGSLRSRDDTTFEAYLPIASAISPSVPTMTRHQANSTKP